MRPNPSLARHASDVASSEPHGPLAPPVSVLRELGCADSADAAAVDDLSDSLDRRMSRAPANFPRIPMENAARQLNRSAGLYLSELQQKGLAVGLFVGTVVGFAALTWGLGVALRRQLR